MQRRAVKPFAAALAALLVGAPAAIAISPDVADNGGGTAYVGHPRLIARSAPDLPAAPAAPAATDADDDGSAAEIAIIAGLGLTGLIAAGAIKTSSRARPRARSAA